MRVGIMGIAVLAVVFLVHVDNALAVIATLAGFVMIVGGLILGGEER